MKHKEKRSLVVLIAVLLMTASLLCGCGGSSAAPASVSTVVQEDQEEKVADIKVIEDEASSETEAEDKWETSEENAVSEEVSPQDENVQEEENTEISSQDVAPAESLTADDGDADADGESALPDEHGAYTSKQEVAYFIHTYGRLPDNFITKKEAEAMGWVSSEGNLDEVAPGMSIGGSRFGNYEGILPEKDGRTYKECDIDYHGGFRGNKRIVYSNDGLIFYTEDHYKTFEQLY